MSKISFTVMFHPPPLRQQATENADLPAKSGCQKRRYPQPSDELTLSSPLSLDRKELAQGDFLHPNVFEQPALQVFFVK
jgi:hypothetical protein